MTTTKTCVREKALAHGKKPRASDRSAKGEKRADRRKETAIANQVEVRRACADTTVGRGMSTWTSTSARGQVLLQVVEQAHGQMSKVGICT